MLTSLNRSFSKIPLLIGGSHTQNSRCFPFTNLLETFGNIQTGKTSFYTDYQNYTEYKNTQGMNVHVHSIGDAATRTVVEGIVLAAAETDVKDGRNAVAHLQVVRPQDIKAFAENNIIAVVAPLWVGKFPIEYDITCSYIGKRADTEYPIKSFYDAGAKVNFHSDYPVSNSMSVARSVYTSVARTQPNLGQEGVHNPAECISRQQALEAMTTNVAYQWHEEDRQGSIAVGKIANFAIFDTDFTKADLDAIWNAKIQATYVDGKIVYGK